MKRQVFLLILLIPLTLLAVSVWTSPIPPRVILGSLFDFRKRQVFPLDETKALTVVKKEELPKEFRYPDQPDRLRGKATKDGKLQWTFPWRISRLVVVPMISTSGWKGTDVYALCDMSQPAPEGSVLLYDVSVLSQETGITIHNLNHMIPRDMTEPLPGEKN